MLARVRVSRFTKVALGLVIAAVAAVLLLLALPAIAPTFVAQRVLGWATNSRCGTFSIDRIDYGGFAPFDLALGRPVQLALEGVRIVSPSGHPLLAALGIPSRKAAPHWGRFLEEIQHPEMHSVLPWYSFLVRQYSDAFLKVLLSNK